MSLIDRADGLQTKQDQALLIRISNPNDDSPTASQSISKSAAIDRAIALILLVPGLPLIVVLSLLVRLGSRGPGIFCQQRVGKHGALFTMYKIRTMRQDAESTTGPTWTSRRDPRITRIGYILRKLHLDELPQLFNVVKGEMALIGPRPERPEFVQVLLRKIPRYLERLDVPPGITGLAQINLPPDTDLDSVRQKLLVDLEYIERTGFSLDLRIFLCTLLRVFGVPGIYAARLTRLHPSSDSLASLQGNDSDEGKALTLNELLAAGMKGTNGSQGINGSNGNHRSHLPSKRRRAPAPLSATKKS